METGSPPARASDERRAAEPSRREERAAGWLVFGVLAVSYAYFFQGGGWNPNSRLDLTRALVERGTIRIDDYVANTGDWSRFDDHYYTNKAPGFSLLSIPFYVAGAAIGRGLFPDDGAAALVVAGYVTNLGANAVPAALLGVMLFHVLRRLGLADVELRAWAALAYGLGTLAFPYSTGYYGHQPGAVLGFAAFAALLRSKDAEHPWRWAAVAGGTAGTAVLVEMSTLVTTVALGLVLLADRAGRGRLVAFVAAGVPPALVLFAYHQVAFGHPLAYGYLYSNPLVMYSTDSVLEAPRASRLFQLLLPESRGLLFTSPLFALAPLGWPRLLRSDARAAAVCLAVPASFLLLIAAFPGWHGGWTPGSRYLVPCLPFLFLPAALAMERFRLSGAVLGGISAAIMLSIAAVAIEVPLRFENPLRDFVWPHLLSGDVSVNPQGLDELWPPDGYLRLEQPDNWSSFNLGELAFPHSVASVLPLVAVWCAGGIALRRLGRAPGRGR